MRIKVEESKPKFFHQLKKGTVFSFNDIFYLKIDTTVDENSINLSDYSIADIYSSTHVIPYESELILEKMI